MYNRDKRFHFSNSLLQLKLRLGNIGTSRFKVKDRRDWGLTLAIFTRSIVASLSLAVFILVALSAFADRAEQILKGHPPVDLAARLSSLPENQRMGFLADQVRKQAPMARGMDLQVSVVRDLFQASLGRLNTAKNQNELLKWLSSEGEIWLNYFERLSYEEGRFSALVQAIQFRTEIWQALSVLFKQKITSDQAILRWLDKMKPVYPVERIFLLEAKAKWPGAHIRSAERMTQMLSGRPGLALSVVSRSLKIPRVKDIMDLEKEWSETQVNLMKAELDSFHKALLLLAVRAFEAKQSQPLKSLIDLQTAGLIAKVPVQESTGKSWELKDLSL